MRLDLRPHFTLKKTIGFAVAKFTTALEPLRWPFLGRRIGLNTMPNREKLHSRGLIDTDVCPFARSFLKPSLIFLKIAILIELFGLTY